LNGCITMDRIDGGAKFSATEAREMALRKTDLEGLQMSGREDVRAAFIGFSFEHFPG
jgi:hypothetical protein